jgi:two-component system OmpR family response regulator
VSTASPGGPPDAGRVPPLRVLCVDEIGEVADSTVMLLRVVGFDARACYGGTDALAEAAAFRPAVCLIDLNMPGMNGDELAERLRAQAGEAPLVLVAVTAMGDEACRRRTAAAGFDLHLVKPVDPHQLLAVVDELWRAWAARAARDGRD